MRRSVLALLAVTLAVATPSASAEAKDPPPSRVRFTAAPGDSLLVHGDYPPVQSSCVDPTQPVLHARYRGTIEVLRAADGSLSLIGELSFEDYLKGIAEVPRDWPMEALKAQVVAARTYALNRMLAGSGTSTYDLCATTECQVYVGMRVEAGPHGERWVQAVEETAGEVLLYEGEPAITYYSSTSPGRTFDVEDVFGGEALPYLRGAPERDDHASPLARWRVEMPFDDLGRFLAAEGLSPGGPVRGVTATQGSIRIDGRDSVTLSKEDLRDVLNATASCRAPSRYPTYEPNGYRLPQTVPSRWYRAGQESNALVLKGRGWGHGIGMVQWGAYGKAERGLGYGEILAAYYGGLTPQPTDVPDAIRILIADGLTRLTVAPSGEASVDPDPGRQGPWLVIGGRGVRLRPGDHPAALLEATGFTGAPRARPGQPYPVSLTVSDDVSVTVEFLQRGDPAATAPQAVLEEEDTRIEVTVPDLPSGRYEVRAIASNGVDVVTTAAVPVRVRGALVAAPSEPSPSPTGTDVARAPLDEDDGVPVGLVTAGALLVPLLVAALLVGLTRRRGRGLHRR